MSKLLNYNYSCGELMLNISTTTSMEHLSTTILQAGRQHHEPAMVRLSWNSEISFHQSSWHYCCTPKIIATWCEKYILYVCGANLAKEALSVDPHAPLKDNEIWTQRATFSTKSGVPIRLFWRFVGEIILNQKHRFGPKTWNLGTYFPI